MKRILSLLVTLALLLPLLGCTKSTTTETTETVPVENSPQILTNIYSESPLSIPQEWNYGGIAGTDESGSLVLYLYRHHSRPHPDNPEETEYLTAVAEMVLPPDPNATPTVTEILTEGPDSSYAQYTLSGEHRYAVRQTYDPETRSNTLSLDKLTPAAGEIQSVENIAALFPASAFDDPRFAQLNAIAADGESYLYLCAAAAVLILTPALTTHAVIEEPQCQDLLTKDGTVYLRCWDENRGSAVLKAIDRNARTLAAPLDVFPAQEEKITGYSFGTPADTSGNLLYFSTETGLYAQKEGADPTLLVSFGNSNLPASFHDLVVLDEEHLYAHYRLGETTVRSLLSKAPDIDLSTVETVTLALCTSTRGNPAVDITAKVIEWNKTHPDIRVQVIDYADDPSRLFRELEAGTAAPDLYYGMPNDIVSYLVSRSLAADLTPYLEADPLWNLDNLFGVVKNTYTHKGILYGLPQTIQVETLLGDRAFFADLLDENDTVSNWTYETLFAMMDENPDVWLDTALTAGDISLLLDCFIDWEAGTCSFDSETFRRYLDRGLHQTDSMPKGGQDAIRAGIEGEAAYEPYRNGTLPLVSRTYRRLPQLGMDVIYYGDYTKGGNEGGVWMGLPTRDGTGGSLLKHVSPLFLLSAATEKGELAWEFLCAAMPNPQTSRDVMGLDQLTPWKHVFDKVVEYEKSMHYYVRYDGGMSGSSSPYELDPDGTYRGQPGIPVDFTKDRTDRFRTFLDTAGEPYNITPGMDELTGIITEEVEIYLAGDCTVDQCTDRIQSRVSLWLAERS